MTTAAARSSGLASETGTVRAVAQAMVRLGLACAIALSAGLPALGSPHLCDAAAAQAARDTGVPVTVLRTLTRVETGRSRSGTLEPWPWTLNMGGAGTWHDSAAAAQIVAETAIAAGRRNVDIGCFQINYRWHGDAFTGIAQMLDPVANARYAARFLRDLHRELGDWTAAAGAFHSRNPDLAARYLARYRDIAGGLAEPDDAVLLAVQVSRTGPAAPMPLSMAARPPLVAPTRAGLPDAARPLWGAP